MRNIMGSPMRFAVRVWQHNLPNNPAFAQAMLGAPSSSISESMRSGILETQSGIVLLCFPRSTFRGGFVGVAVQSVCVFFCKIASKVPSDSFLAPFGFHLGNMLEARGRHFGNLLPLSMPYPHPSLLAESKILLTGTTLCWLAESKAAIPPRV